MCTVYICIRLFLFSEPDWRISKCRITTILCVFSKNNNGIVKFQLEEVDFSNSWLFWPTFQPPPKKYCKVTLLWDYEKTTIILWISWARPRLNLGEEPHPMKKLNGNQVTLVAASSIPKSGNRNGTYGTWKEKTPLNCHCDICDNLNKNLFSDTLWKVWWFDGWMQWCKNQACHHPIPTWWIFSAHRMPCVWPLPYALDGWWSPNWVHVLVYLGVKHLPICRSHLGGGFNLFLFSPLPGGMIPILTCIFQMGWFNHQLGISLLCQRCRVWKSHTVAIRLKVTRRWCYSKSE